MNSKPLRCQVRSLVLLAGAAVVLAACQAQAGVPTNYNTSEADVTPLPPSHTIEPVDEGLDASTSPLASTVTISTPTIPTSTAVPTLPVCSSGALLFTHAYGQNEGGQTLYEVYWVCSGNSFVQFIASGIRAIDMVISPNGRWVAFGGEVLQIMELSSREKMTLSDEVPDEGIYNPSWSPDGEYIVYQRHRAIAGYSPIEVIHLSSGAVSTEFIPGKYKDQITLATISGIVWLPGGNQVLLYGNYTQDLYLLDVVCDNTPHLCVAENMTEIPTSRNIKEAPAVSPDGVRIAALCTVPDTHPVKITLCILDFNGNMIYEFGLEDLGLDYVYHLAWSPDSTQIAFDDVGSIYIFSLSDQSITRLGVTGSQPVWLP